MKRVWLLATMLTLLFGDEMKVCESEQDKMSGCVEKEYYDNGRLRTEASFSKGELNGWSRTYGENGDLKIEVLFEKGEGTEFVIHDKDGIARISFRNKMKKEGVAREYYPNGALKREEPFRNDMIEGVVREYYSSGALKLEIPFKKDKADGLRRHYYENGGIMAEAFLKNGETDGRWAFYYEDGRLAREATYKNGKISGEKKWYNRRGDLMFSVIYSDDEPVSGKCANGKILTNAHLQNLKRKGIMPSCNLGGASLYGFE